jgi:uncharacterized protein (TIGR03435 family)
MNASTLITGLLTAFLAAAQPASVTAFEVVSIKPHPEPIYVSSSSTSGMTTRWIAGTLMDLLVDAYDLKYYQISGTPNWAETAHFDIVAKAEGDRPPDPEHYREMVRSLLTNRFQLKAHRELKEIPVYALVVGKNGHKLSPPDMNSRQGGAIVSAGTVHTYTAHGVMQRLADQLSNTAGRPVLDKTGLAGEFAYDLKFTLPDSVTSANSDIPSMFTALQEQLGLRLEPQSAPVEVLVIESAQKPSEN